MRAFFLMIFISIVCVSARADLVADCYAECFNGETFEEILVQRDLGGHGDCHSQKASRSWIQQCASAIRKWSPPDECLSVTGLVRKNSRCE